MYITVILCELNISYVWVFTFSALFLRLMLLFNSCHTILYVLYPISFFYLFFSC